LDPFEDRELARRVSRKVALRILPFSVLVFAISFLDRANISYAALAMGRDLDLGAEAFGFAAGVFFVGYFLCEVPSNLALARFGARRWLARIQLSWGLVACASAFVQSAHQLYLARFLLGIAEAGLIPGLMAYFTFWFPVRRLARVGAVLGLAVPAAYMLSGPLSTWIMGHVNLFGLTGWRSMLLIEGAPALLTGLLTLVVLCDGPDEADWLSPSERRRLAVEISDRSGPLTKAGSAWSALVDPRTLFLGLVYFLFQVGNFGIGLWLPQLVKETGRDLTTVQVGWLSAIPYAAAAVGLYLWSASSDRLGERRWHAAMALLLAGLALAASALSRGLVPAIILLSASLMGFYAFKAPFGVIPRLYLSPASAVIAFAVVNAMGNAGSFLGPYLFGLIKARTHGPQTGLLVLSAVTLLAAVLTLFARFGEPQAGRGGSRTLSPAVQHEHT